MRPVTAPPRGPSLAAMSSPWLVIVEARPRRSADRNHKKPGLHDHGTPAREPRISGYLRPNSSLGVINSQPISGGSHSQCVSNSDLENTDNIDRSAVHWLDQTGTVRMARPSANLLDQKLYLAAPIRKGNRYQGRRNYHGRNWVSATAAHVWHESMYERYALLDLDFRHDLVAIASQPMRLTLSNGDSHVPDFIALHADYRQVVYDVKPASRVTAKAQRQFDLTAELCERVGWGYEVFSEAIPLVRTNVEWLANFRHHRFRPPPPALANLTEALTVPLNVRDGAAAMRLPNWNGGVGAIYHLAWVGELTLDLTQQLSYNTPIRKAPTHVHH